MPTHPPKGLLDRAVVAAQLYCGSVGRVRLRDEQRLYDRAKKAAGRVASKAGIDSSDAFKQILDEAKRRGCKLAMPGKDL